MLAVMNWNTTQLAQLDAERRVVARYISFSKPRGEDRQVTRREVVSQPWKKELIRRSVDQKRVHGPGLPVLDQDDDDEGDEDEQQDIEVDPPEMLMEETESESGSEGEE